MKSEKIKLILIMIFSFVMSWQVNKAQEKEDLESGNENKSTYKNAIGMRVGVTSGLTVKHFISSDEAIEGILGTSLSAIGVTGLYERYIPIGDLRGFNWYFGGGGHLSFGTPEPYYYIPMRSNESRYVAYHANNAGIGLGVDGLVGLEYKIFKAPIAISLDAKPFVELNTTGDLFTALDASLGVKITF